MRSAVRSLILLSLLTAPLAAQVDRRIMGSATLEDVPAIPADVAAAAQGYQAGSVANLAGWSADGRLRILTRSTGLIQLHRPDGANAAPLASYVADTVGVPRAVPGSDRILFSRDAGGDEWFQLFTMRPGGQPLQLTEPGTRNEAPVFQRDGRRVFWAKAVPGSADYTIEAADPSDASGRVTVYRATGAVAPTDISADGRTLLLVRARSNTAHELALLDLGTGTVRSLLHGKPAIASDARFTSNGAAIVVLSNRDSDARSLLMIDIATGDVRSISTPGRWDVEDYAVSPDGRLIAYALNVEGTSQLAMRELATGRMLPVPRLPLGIVTGLEFAPDSTRLAIAFAGPNTPGDIWTWHVGGGELTRWSASEVGVQGRRQMPEPQIVRFSSFDRVSVPALVYRPLGIDPRTRTPVIISIHGGPEAQARPGWTPSLGYLTQTLGATVIAPNVRGSDGYGRRYLALDDGVRREDAVRDIGALLDWIRKQPGLDADRVAVIGGSYGGYMTMASLARYGRRLVGGMSSFGIGDWSTFLANTEAYRRDNRRAEYGDERDPKMRRFFDRISPRANVDRIVSPLLIAQGANDPRVPESESEQMVAALRARRVPVGYVRFADEGHGWRNRANIDLAREVETAFLQRLFDRTGGTGTIARR